VCVPSYFIRELNLFPLLSFFALFFAKFVGGWESVGPKYPFSTDEAEGLIIGNDLVQFSGYTQRFASATNFTYAKDITIPGSAWRRMGNVPVEIALTHVASVLIGTKVYICGGYTGISGGRHSPDCFVYDHSLPPGPGQWSTTAIPSLPHGGTGGAGMIYDAASNSLFYTGGAQRFSLGSKEATDLTNTFKYSFSDPSVGWVPSTPLPYSGNHLSYVTHRLGGQERHFFLAGQETEFERNVSRSDHFEFIPSNETWIRRASLPFGRGHMSASTRAIGCGFLIAGGSINSPPPYRAYTRTNDVSYYDIPTNTWTSIGIVPVAAASPIADIHPDGYMYYTDDTLRRRKINTGI
jgi:Kelch motif